jgi:hypothetical protein
MGNVAFQQPVAVLGEYRRVPDLGLDRQADEPDLMSVSSLKG